MDTRIDGYVYTGDVGSVADYGGKWLGVRSDNLGHVIEVIGASDLGSNVSEVSSGHIYVSGHNAMRQAVESCGWDILGISDREQRRAMLLDAYVGYYGFDTDSDFGGDYRESVNADDDDADAQVIAIANRWAR